MPEGAVTGTDDMASRVRGIVKTMPLKPTSILPLLGDPHLEHALAARTRKAYSCPTRPTPEMRELIAVLRRMRIGHIDGVDPGELLCCCPDHVARWLGRMGELP